MGGTDNGCIGIGHVAADYGKSLRGKLCLGICNNIIHVSGRGFSKYERFENFSPGQGKNGQDQKHD